MSDLYDDYLQHHGILGQKHGVRNGPPYPLSKRLHAMVVSSKEESDKKKRTKILHDPKKLSKHVTEFSKEEIDSAVDKMESIKRLKRQIEPSKKEERKIKRAEEKAKAKAEKQLIKKMDKYAPDNRSLLENASKFTSEEFKAASDRLKNKEEVFKQRLDELNRPKKYLDVGLGYVDTGIDAIKKFKEVKSLLTPKYDENGFTEDMRVAKKRFDYARAHGNDLSFLVGDKSTLSSFLTILGDERSQADKKVDEKTAKKIKDLEMDKADLNRKLKSYEESLNIANEASRPKKYNVKVSPSKNTSKQSSKPQSSNITSDTIWREAVKASIKSHSPIKAKSKLAVMSCAYTPMSDVNDSYSKDLQALIPSESYYTQKKKYGRVVQLSDIDENSSVSFSDGKTKKSQNELAHHGIKGQMWGVRNGPPYPLDSKTHAKVKKQKFARVGSLVNIEEGEKYDNRIHYPSYELHKLSRELFENTDKPIKMSINTLRQYPGTDKADPNSLDIGAKYIPAHSLKKVEDDGWDPYRNRNILYDQDQYRLDVDTIRKRTPMKMPQYLDDNNSAFLKNQMKKVNPDFGERGTTNNCAKCAATLTLMKMGYNQVQAGLSDNGSISGNAGYWFSGGEVKKTNDLNDIANALNEAPNGSFGTLGCGRMVNGRRVSGHAMSWTKTRNGKVRIEDGQDTKIYDSFEDVVRKQNFTSGTLATFARLDNAKPNWSALASDGVCQLPGNTAAVNSFGTTHEMDTISGYREKPKISRSNYSIFDTPISNIDKMNEDLDSLWKNL